LTVDSLQSEWNDLSKKKDDAKVAAKLKTLETKMEGAKANFATVSAETVEELKYINGSLEADAIELAVCDYYDELRDYFLTMGRYYSELVPVLFEFRRHVQEARERRAAAVALAKHLGEVRDDQMFGLPLEDLLRKEKSPDLPQILTTTVLWLEANGANSENIFAVAVPPTELAALKAQVDHIGRSRVDLSGHPSPHTIASLLKMFLRELPNPLTTFKLFDAFMDINSTNKTTQSLTHSLG